MDIRTLILQGVLVVGIYSAPRLCPRDPVIELDPEYAITLDQITRLRIYLGIADATLKFSGNDFDNLSGRGILIAWVGRNRLWAANVESFVQQTGDTSMFILTDSITPFLGQAYSLRNWLGDVIKWEGLESGSPDVTHPILDLKAAFDNIVYTTESIFGKTAEEIFGL